jgi:hypothetical protein
MIICLYITFIICSLNCLFTYYRKYEQNKSVDQKSRKVGSYKIKNMHLKYAPL